MKVDNKSNESDPGVTQEKVIYCDFKDKAIDKLFIKSGNRITVKFKKIQSLFFNKLLYVCI